MLTGPGPREDALTVIGLVLALALPLATTRWNPPRDCRGPENRPLAPRPRWPADTSDLDAFTAASEAFLRDHFGGRDACIRAWNRAHLALFDRSAAPGVLAGRDGWLYYTGDESVAAFRGALATDDGVLDRWASRLADRAAWLKDRGVRFVFAPAPDKQTIHPEHMPSHVAPGRGPTRLDALFARLAPTQVTAVDLRPALRGARASGPVYLATDSHWNERGAAVAADAIARRLGDRLKLNDPPALAWLPAPRRDGDLATMLALGDLTEETVLAHPPVPPLDALTAAPATPGPRILVLHDSFGEFARFLAPRVGRLIEQATQDLDPAVCDAVPPDAVVQEVVERALNRSPAPDRPCFGDDRELRRAFRIAPERHADPAGVALPPDTYAVLRVDLERDSAGAASLEADTPGGRQIFERAVSPGRNIVYLVAGGPTGAHALRFTVHGAGATRVRSVELGGGLSALDLVPPAGRLLEPLGAWTQELALSDPVGPLAPGASAMATVRVRNPGPRAWLPDGTPDGRHAVRLAALWLTADGRTTVNAPPSAALPPIGPGVTAQLRVPLAAPPSAGRYLLRLTAVQEGVGLFCARGGTACDQLVDVRP